MLIAHNVIAREAQQVQVEQLKSFQNIFVPSSRRSVAQPTSRVWTFTQSLGLNSKTH